MDTLEQIWSFKLSLAPVLFIYLVFEISSIVRRFMRIAYTPIYFMFFPLGHADSLYSYYFNDDVLYIGASQTAQEKKALRRKIISVSVFSMVFSTVLNPALAGIVAALLLTSAEFNQFFWFLIVVKSILIAISLYNARHIAFVERSGAYPWVVATYGFYLLIIARVVESSYAWGVVQVSEVGAAGLLVSIADFIAIDVLVYVVFTAFVGAAISYWMTDPSTIPEMEVIMEPVLINEE